MAETLQIACNAVVAQLRGASKETRDFVAEKLSYMVEGVEFMGAGTWNGRSSFYARRTETFPAGFVHLIQNELTAKGHRVSLIRKPLPAPLGPENPIVDEFGNDDPRYDFQLRALRQVEKHGRGIIQVATGGGKSKIAKLIAARYRRMTMFLTTRGILMYQMKDGFEAAGLRTGIIGDGEFAPVRGINVGMVQTFVAKLEETTLDAEVRAVIRQNHDAIARAKKKGLPEPAVLSRAEVLALAKPRLEEKTRERARMIKLLEMVEVVIGEEAHEAGGDSYFKILQHCKNAQIRIALTATPFMRDAAEDNMRLMAAFGPVLLKVSEKLLIDRGILARPYFKFITCEPHSKLRRTSPWQRAYQLGIVEAPARNQAVINYAIKARRCGLPVMILIQRKEHGATLLRMLKEAGIQAKFIQGENNQEERKKALDALGAGRIECLIGTTILDVGVDVPAVSMVIQAGGGKAEVANRQRIGRGLRAKKNLPNTTFIVDFEDGVNDHLRGHAHQRRQIIEQTPGFAEGILGPGQDFDWSIYKNFRAAA